MEIRLAGAGGNRATDRGTPITKPGEDMDKHAFLKILSAQLRNQDPLAADQDSTQYVTQMAQFTSMEQMQNLNNTMTNYSNQSLVGKGVSVDVLDGDGNPYTGIVKAVNNSGGTTTISMEVNEGGKNVYKEFDINSVKTVLGVPDYSLPVINNVNGNMSFLLASSFIGKEVELTEKDSSDKNYVGTVTSAFKEDGLIKVKVKLKDSDEEISVTIDKINKIGEIEKKENEDSSEEEEKKVEEKE